MKTAGKHRMQLKQNHLLWKEMTLSLNLVKVETSSSSFILWIIEKIIWCFQCLMKLHLFLLCIQGVLVSTQSNVLIGQTTTRRLFVFFLFVFFKQRRTTLCRSSLTTAKHQGCLNCSGQACHNGGTLTA